MRKTKIVCTLGPATDQGDILRRIALSGMNVARFNFSHGTHNEHFARLKNLKQIREELNLPIAALLDTRGPEIRLRNFENGKVILADGSDFTLTTRDLLGNTQIASVTYQNLPTDVTAGTKLLLDDGLIELAVTDVVDHDIHCKVVHGGPISNHKSVNVPGVALSMPYLSAQDESDILFGIENDFDFIAASFVRCARDILDIRELLDTHKCESIKIIAKLENAEGVANIDEILPVSDGIMIARGDMGVEIDFTEIPIIQKRLIVHCSTAGKPVITATQMLESMILHARPTRAEMSDVANAIYDGTSAIMLSGETAAGKFPVEALQTMAAIAERTEQDINYDKRLRARSAESHLSVADAIAHSACTTAVDVGSKAIVTITHSGETARLVCKYRPSAPIIACAITQQTCRHLAVSWGISPVVMPLKKTTDEALEHAIQLARRQGYVKSGDLAVVTAGVPIGVPGTTNMIKVHLVGDTLLSGVGVGKLVGIGRLAICKNEKEVAALYHPGDVLVMPSTSNAILDEMRTAAAIVTEEPGLNSHAAIVGLTLGKPVLVGAVGATTRLKNGSDVAVDTERGIVRAISE
ncbi:MAG: pyruvate kinase [Candidatus Fimivivens sp.]